MKTPKYNVSVRPTDGNAYSILNAVTKAMQQEGATKEERDEYFKRATEDDYDHLISVSQEYVNLKETK